MSKFYLSKIIFTLLCLILISTMLIEPKLVLKGALDGLNTWWNIVLPSLLPFFIASELLLACGIVRFMGVLLEPIMRPLFNVPGSGSFVLCLGFTSGSPIGAMLTANLRSQKLCTKKEAERLLSFTNNASPLFMLAAISVGMLNQSQLGILIISTHYLANLTLGVFLRFYGRKEEKRLQKSYKSPSHSGLFKKAWKELILAWEEEKRPLGGILSEVIKKSVNNLIAIGGFIILFSVIIKLLFSYGIMDYLAKSLSIFLLPLGFSEEILPSLAGGLFEITNGARLITEANVPLKEQLLALSIILGFGGISIQAQVAGMISKTDISIKIFILTRIAHALLACLYMYLLIPRVNHLIIPALSLEKNIMELCLWNHLELALVFLIASSILFFIGALFFKRQ